PVKIIDPHLVSSIFYYYKRVYLHYTTELENRSAWVAECSLNIQVTTRVEGNISLEGHILTQHVSIPVGSQVQYTFPEMGYYIYDTDIKFHADMNFNMIRCWGGGLAERPKFYHYCDIYGLL
ncbi:mannosylglycoprotein endo-beta-mannosidase, partial [Quercus suber]